MIPPTPWVRSFCPLSLLYPSVSDFQFRYTPVTVGKGRAASGAFWVPNPKNHIEFWDYNPKIQYKFWD